MRARGEHKRSQMPCDRCGKIVDIDKPDTFMMRKTASGFLLIICIDCAIKTEDTDDVS